MKQDRHGRIVARRKKKSATYRRVFERTLQQIDLALLVREMREHADLTQSELAKKVGTTQSVIARLEGAEYARHSLTMLKRIAAACGVGLRLLAEKKPDFEREVALVWVNTHGHKAEWQEAHSLHANPNLLASLCVN